MSANLIFKNTLFLYLRSILTLIISLYTSRLVLIALGIEDWGIFSVVGGFVSMFGFLNSSTSLSLQRFLSFEMTKPNGKTHLVFCQGVNIILIITILIFILLELCGSIYIYYVLNVPENKRLTAFWVFQFSTLSLIFTMLKVPYSAFMIAKERLDIFAYLDIINVGLKLIFVSFLAYMPHRILLYAAYFALISTMIYITTKFLCNRLFQESRNYVYCIDKTKSLEILKFTGWTTCSSIGMILRDQVLNLMLNNYLGLTVNAAYGIARQVSSSIQGFVSNVVVAFSPPIIKSYASGNIAQTNRLLVVSSKMCSVLILILFIPLFFEMDFILGIWLKNVPEYTSLICKYSVFVIALIFIVGNNAIVIRATGNIKKYELSVNLFNLLFLAISYLILRNGYSIHLVFLSLILLTLMQLLYMLHMTSGILQVQSITFIYEVVVKLILTIIPSMSASYYILCNVETGIVRLSMIIVITTFLMTSCTYFLYLNKDEKIFVGVVLLSIKNKVLCKK